MKKLLLIAAAAFMVMPGMAQQAAPTQQGEKATAETRAQRRTDKMVTELALTPEQTTKVHAANLTLVRKTDAIKAKYPDTKTEAAKTELKAARSEFQTTMKSVLTAQQYTRMEEKHKAQKRKGSVERK